MVKPSCRTDSLSTYQKSHQQALENDLKLKLEEAS